METQPTNRELLARIEQLDARMQRAHNNLDNLNLFFSIVAGCFGAGMLCGFGSLIVRCFL